MPIQPEYATQYDKNLDRNVVLVRTEMTDKYKKFVFDRKFDGFVEAPEVVLIHDLVPQYQTECEHHSKIFFCKNLAKNEEIHKYAYSFSEKQFQRVQCSCCEYDKLRIGTYFRHNENQESKGNFRLVSHMMNATLLSNQVISPKELVDEENMNFFWIRPFHSDICLTTNEIVIFCLIYPENKVLQAYSFDQKTQKFTKSCCECKKCSTIDHTFNSFDHGSQGIGHRRSHRDRNGLPLVCLAMTWKNSYEGLMNIFCDEQGYIGKYEYNYDQKCFDLLELLDIRVHSHIQDTEVKKRPDLLFDDCLRVLYPSHCDQLNRTFFFGYHQMDTTMQKWTFNEYSHQFEIFKCSDCKFEHSKVGKPTSESVFFPTLSLLTGKMIGLRLMKDRSVEKTVQVDDEFSVKLKKAPIRNLLHLDTEKLVEHYGSRKVVSQELPTQVIESDGTEKWVTTRHSSGVTVFLTGMDGKVKLHRIENNDDDVKEWKYLAVDEQGNLLNEDEKISARSKSGSFVIPTKSELSEPAVNISTIVEGYTYCPHFKRIMLYAFYDIRPIQLLLTSDYLIQVKCNSCESKRSGPHVLKASNNIIFPCEGGFAHRVVYAKNRTMIQKIEYDNVTKTWNEVHEYSIRMLKGIEEEWARRDKELNEPFKERNYCCDREESFTSLMNHYIVVHGKGNNIQKRKQMEIEIEKELKLAVTETEEDVVSGECTSKLQEADSNSIQEINGCEESEDGDSMTDSDSESDSDSNSESESESESDSGSDAESDSESDSSDSESVDLEDGQIPTLESLVSGEVKKEVTNFEKQIVTTADLTPLHSEFCIKLHKVFFFAFNNVTGEHGKYAPTLSKTLEEVESPIEYKPKKESQFNQRRTVVFEGGAEYLVDSNGRLLRVQYDKVKKILMRVEPEVVKMLDQMDDVETEQFQETDDFAGPTFVPEESERIHKFYSNANVLSTSIFMKSSEYQSVFGEDDDLDSERSSTNSYYSDVGGVGNTVITSNHSGVNEGAFRRSSENMNSIDDGQDEEKYTTISLDSSGEDDTEEDETDQSVEENDYSRVGDTEETEEETVDAVNVPPTCTIS